ncbi:MAG: NAD-dependent epimerase/dehydratase [Microgenomates group bacterium Gr01-1014_5]|nr:MAG: NAD-dependent epimerase/dehydratase [Microgenomates group bacterium Gr01-1014_5]
MDYKNILVTGGAGFIGSFLVDELIKKGYSVRIFDNLEEQVHQGKTPSYLNPKAEFIKGDVRNYEELSNALEGIDAVFHLASSVGVAQSNYEIKTYSDVNVGGTANLLDILIKKEHPVKKIITNSSMTGYGEGNYKCEEHGIVRPPIRDENQLTQKDWELKCPKCGVEVKAKATNEEASEYPNSVYAITKKAQQDMLLLYGKTYNIPTIALRCFNVYGPRQSLSNPYTGVTAIFISRIKNNQPAVVYEDGMQTRDFVSVHDVVRAQILCLESDSVKNEVFNIGSGIPIPIKEIAETLDKHIGNKGLVEVGGSFRKGDIRNCFADISKAQKVLGWEPEVSLAEGFKELIEWSEGEKAEDKFSQAEKELKKKGIL